MFDTMVVDFPLGLNEDGLMVWAEVHIDSVQATLYESVEEKGKRVLSRPLSLSDTETVNGEVKRLWGRRAAKQFLLSYKAERIIQEASKDGEVLPKRTDKAGNS